MNTARIEYHGNRFNQSVLYILKKEITFNSISAAASFCLGNNSNGWIEWKT